MLQPADAVIDSRLAADNPWWRAGADALSVRHLPHRFAFAPFYDRLVGDDRRPLCLTGPHGAGKTVLLRQAIARLIADGYDPATLLWLPLDAPLVAADDGMACLHRFAAAQNATRAVPRYAFLDGLDRLPDGLSSLDRLASTWPDIRLVAAAAGPDRAPQAAPGRVDSILPALTFAEFIAFSRHLGPIGSKTGAERRSALDTALRAWLNIGSLAQSGIPGTPAGAPPWQLAGALLDRALDAATLARHGIQEPDALLRFLLHVVARTGAETAYETLARDTGLAKNTLRKFLACLEAAGLVRRLDRRDGRGRRYERATRFILHVAQPALYTALFGPVRQPGAALTALAQAGYFSQGPQGATACYAGWADRTVDAVYVSEDSTPITAACLAGSDEICENPAESLAPLIEFARNIGLASVDAHTRTRMDFLTIDGVAIRFLPLAVGCYSVPLDVLEAGDSGLVDPRALRAPDGPEEDETSEDAAAA